MKSLLTRPDESKKKVRSRLPLRARESEVSDHSLRRLPTGRALSDLWARVRRAHSTGRHDDEALAAMFAHEGVTVAGLRARRTRDRRVDKAAWPIDTSRDVAIATRAILTQQAQLEAGGQAEAVMAAARQVAGVLTRHRSSAGMAHDVCLRLLGELDATSTRKDDLERLLRAAESGLEGEALAAIRGQFRNFMALHHRAGSMAKLADALAKAQQQERKAWGVPEDPKESSPVDAMTDEQLQAEIARLGDEIAQMRANPSLAAALPPEAPVLQRVA